MHGNTNNLKYLIAKIIARKINSIANQKKTQDKYRNNYRLCFIN